MSVTTANSPRPLRVAIVGAGPAGFFGAESLLKAGIPVEVDIFDKKPVPFGLVRFGVAPDHDNIKAVTRNYARTLVDENVEFFGNVAWWNTPEGGASAPSDQVLLSEALDYYDQVLFTIGAPSDFKLALPGEDSLEGVHAAREFVGWFNCDSQCASLEFRRDASSVFIIGVGNVALDVARILIRPVAELAATDIADHALDWLRESRVTDIHLVARRGPLQLACTYAELKELTAFEHLDVIVRPEDFGDITEEALAANKSQRKSVELLRGFAGKPSAGRRMRLHFDFYRSPSGLIGEGGRLEQIELVKNQLADRGGYFEAEPIPGSEYREPADLVFRAIRYRGEPFPGLPFDEKRGVIANDRGRVNGISRVYVAGWIKRGASGIIGTNKPDAAETVKSMLEDAEQLALTGAPRRGISPVSRLRAAGHPVIDKEQWFALDREEIRRGGEGGRNRVRFIHLDDILAFLQRQSG